MILVLYVFGLLAIIYFLLLRPQKKRKNEHRQMIAALTPDCEIVTIGGLHGRVSAVNEKTVSIVMRGGGEAEFEKEAIARIAKPKTV